MIDMDFTPSQSDAMLQVKHWHDGAIHQTTAGEKTFRLFGYAGTGKTTLARHFAEGISGSVLFCAYTGKAASVMRKKGCRDATTIHKILYKPAPKGTALLEELTKSLHDREDQLKQAGQSKEQVALDPEVIRIHKALEDEKEGHRPRFVLNEDSPIREASLLVIDECSMVSGQLGQDLESFNVPILVLGDPAQLPPVKGCGYFTDRDPDILLTEIHRQAKDNPILRLATDIREGRSLQLGNYGDSKVIRKKDVDRQEVLSYNQVLVGKNVTRFEYNARIRKLLERGDVLPVGGDRVVCLRNDHEVGILNGSQWVVKETTQTPLPRGDKVELEMVIASEDDPPEQAGSSLAITAHQDYFLGEEPHYWEIKDRQSMDWGYCLTVHKSQGSQWPSVYIFDESAVFRQDWKKWLYTGVTRASEKVTIVVE